MQVSAHVYMVLSRLLAFCAALWVFYCELNGSRQTRDLLFGIQSPSKPSNTYSSYQIVSLLKSIVIDQQQVQDVFNSIALLDSIVYLDSDIDTQTMTLNSTCNEISNADYLYDISFVQPIVKHSMAAYPSTWNDIWYVVDCTFDGRVNEDSSSFKIHLIDKNWTQFTNLFIQTLDVSLPRQQRTTTGGAATFTTTSFLSLYIDEHDEVSSKDLATHSITVGFGFPYDWYDFKPVRVENQSPTSASWQGHVVNSGNPLSFSGTEGIYRSSISTKANYGSYIWQLPDNPIEYASTIQYVNNQNFRDAWGWFRCFLGVGIAFNLGLNTFVSMLVMGNLWDTEKVFWMPDIYPSIQRRATLRAILLLVDSFMGTWWYPYVSALNQGFYRIGLPGTLELEAMTRDDCLMICLACTFVVADTLRVRIHLAVVVLIYMICFAYRLVLIDTIGLYLSATNEYLENEYNMNLLAGNGGMDMWMSHENYETNHWLIVTECTWLILAIGISVVYTTCVAYLQHRSHSNRGILKLLQKHLKQKEKIAHVGLAVVRHRHWLSRSTLYEQLSLLDTDNTQVERSVGWILENEYGFIASTENYEEVHGQRVVTRSGVWLLGFVVVDKSFLVPINAYLFLLLNVLFQRQIFRVTAFRVDGDIVRSSKERVFYNDLSLSKIWSVSLIPLK